MKTSRTSRVSTNPIGDYIRGFDPDVQRVRSTIRQAVPRAEESISYRIPTYKLNGRPVIYFAAFKEHYSVYPVTATVVAALKKDLEPYAYNGKGTVRFPFSAPVPVKKISSAAATLGRCWGMASHNFGALSMLCSIQRSSSGTRARLDCSVPLIFSLRSSANDISTS